MVRYEWMKAILVLALSLGAPWMALAQLPVVYTNDDVQIWRSKMSLSKTAQVSHSVSEVAKSFLGTPYVAHTLEVTPREQLVINLKGLDCTTFVENALALATQLPDTSFSGFCQRLQQLRYRNDSIAGYASRMHYLSEWLYVNEQKGILENQTAQLGGKPYNKTLQFMSSHRAAYKQLKSEENYQAVLKVEKALADRKMLYIPKADVSGIEKQLMEGDIIAITTSVPGLDASHVGFATWQNGRVYLLHASSDAGRVLISEKPLAEYLAGNKSQTGIMVARLRK